MEHSSMNDRIRELKEQATRTAMWIGDPDAGELDAEKFAELIIAECGIALRPMLRDMISRGQAHELIKQHFGVDK